MSKKVLKRGMFLLAPLAAFVLSSCIDVNEAISVNPNGSGVLKLAYQISRLVVDMPKSANTEFTLPLPPNSAQFRSNVEAGAGLTLQKLSPIDGSQNVGADATIAFARVGDLNTLLSGNSKDRVTLTENAGVTTFTQVIYPGADSAAAKQTVDLAKKLFSGYKLLLSLQAPRPIQKANFGKLSSDKTTVTYTTTIPAIIESTKPVIWEVSW